jgi:MFS family permease
MSAPSSSVPWYRQLNGYHWFVFIVASAAWFFDCLDQRIFSLARIPALAALMDKPPSDPGVQAFGKVVTAWFLVGWGTGGMLFGALGDRYGRAKMLTVTVLIYSICTGLSYFSQHPLDFTIFRFLTGLGVGGVFGLAVSLIAETVPSGARSEALGMLQVLSTVGNVTAGFALKGVALLDANKVIAPGSGWRWMFLIGALPAVMFIFTHKKLREPEPWLKLKAEGKLPTGSIFAPYIGLLQDRQYRRNLIVGALIASTGVVGLWAIAEYAVDLQTALFNTHFAAHVPDGVADPKLWVRQQVDDVKFKAYILQMLGAALGMWSFTKLAGVVGRRVAFGIGFSVALIVTVFAYAKMETPVDAYWMMFFMGAVQLGPFAGFAIYLPELFPSRLRSTGVSFCYNLGRFAAAAGSLYSAELSKYFAKTHAAPAPLRYSAIVMCVIFLVGLVTLFFAPETKGKPLPEEGDGAVKA